jgi:aminotransferase EvaB
VSSRVVVPAGDLSGLNSKFVPLVSDVIAQGKLIGGSHVTQFENQLSEYVGTKHAISVASGMDALVLAIQALNFPPKSKIAVLNCGGGYASLAVLSCGHIPVFCDSTTTDIQLDFADLHKLEKLSGVIVTHLYGQLTEISQILEWAHQKDVRVIEDCAQAFGAERHEKRAGSFGDVGCFSFYPTKNLGGIGDGGAVVTNSDVIAKSISRLKQYGWGNRYNIEFRDGRNSRLDAINAVVLSAKILEIDSMNSRRREIFSKYLEADLSNTLFPNQKLDSTNVVHLAVGLCSNPSGLIDFFAEVGIEVGQHYPMPDSMQPGLNYLSEERATPNADWICRSNVTFPLYPHLTQNQVELVAKTIGDWVKRG